MYYPDPNFQDLKDKLTGQFAEILSISLVQRAQKIEHAKKTRRDTKQEEQREASSLWSIVD